MRRLIHHRTLVGTLALLGSFGAYAGTCDPGQVCDFQTIYPACYNPANPATQSSSVAGGASNPIPSSVICSPTPPPSNPPTRTSGVGMHVCPNVTYTCTTSNFKAVCSNQPAAEKTLPEGTLSLGVSVDPNPCGGPPPIIKGVVA